MFSFFKKKARPRRVGEPAAIGPRPHALPAAAVADTPKPVRRPHTAPDPRRAGWLDRLRQGLRKTGSSIAQVFTGTQIDDALYEELESALLMADAGVKATEFLLADLKRRVKETQGHRAARP